MQTGKVIRVCLASGNFQEYRNVSDCSISDGGVMRVYDTEGQVIITYSPAGYQWVETVTETPTGYGM